MVTRWHLLHLPVQIDGASRPYSFVQEVVIGWPERKLLGILIGFRWFRPRYIPIGPGVSVTTMGITLTSPQLIEVKTRRWWKNYMRQGWALKDHPVVGEEGQLLGIVKDVMIDEDTLVVHELIASRGVLGDLLQGALILPAKDVVEDSSGEIKMIPDGAT